MSLHGTERKKNNIRILQNIELEEEYTKNRPFTNVL